MAKRQQFTEEFKLEAVRLWKYSGKPAAGITREEKNGDILNFF